MSVERKRRRGTTTEHSSFTGAEGEITFDTTRTGLVVHDGSTQGGFPVPTALEIAKQSFTAVDFGGTSSAWTATLPLNLPSPTTDYPEYLKIAGDSPFDSIGAVTLAVNSHSAKPVKIWKDGVLSDIAEGDLLNGKYYELVYDGTNFQVQAANPTLSAHTLIADVDLSSLTPASEVVLTEDIQISTYRTIEVIGTLVDPNLASIQCLQFKVVTDWVTTAYDGAYGSVWGARTASSAYNGAVISRTTAASGGSADIVSFHTVIHLDDDGESIFGYSKGELTTDLYMTGFARSFTDPIKGIRLTTTTGSPSFSAGQIRVIGIK